MQGKHPSCTKSRPSQNCQAHALPLMTITCVQKGSTLSCLGYIWKADQIQSDTCWFQILAEIRFGHPTKSTRIYPSRHHHRLHLSQLLGERANAHWCCLWCYYFYDVSVPILVGASFYRLGTDWICEQMAAIGWVESQLARSIVACTSKTTGDRDCLVKTGKAERPQSTSEKEEIGLRCTTTNFESGSGIVWRGRGVLPSNSGSETGWSCQTPLRLSGTGSSRTLSLGWWHGRWQHGLDLPPVSPKGRNISDDLHRDNTDLTPEKRSIIALVSTVSM